MDGKEKMKILVDADACPVIGIVEELARKYKRKVILLCDTIRLLISAGSALHPALFFWNMV